MRPGLKFAFYSKVKPTCQKPQFPIEKTPKNNIYFHDVRMKKNK
jgi:hypothetical protein